MVCNLTRIKVPEEKGLLDGSAASTLLACHPVQGQPSVPTVQWSKARQANGHPRHEGLGQARIPHPHCSPGCRGGVPPIGLGVSVGGIESAQAEKLRTTSLALAGGWGGLGGPRRPKEPVLFLLQ